jgi:hypothetical protein
VATVISARIARGDWRALRAVDVADHGDAAGAARRMQGRLANKVQGSASQDRLGRQSGKFDRSIPNVISQWNTAGRGTMLGRMARRVRDLSTRGVVLVCFVFIVVSLPIAGHADEAIKLFDINAQPLSEALMAFGAQTGAIVMASSELTTGKISKPVTGQLTPQEALSRMLEGTGLKFETSPNGAILIVRASPPGR